MLRVLLVEDNPIYRAVLKDQLSQSFPNSTIDEAGSSEEGLMMIKGALPHLVFADIHLPGMNGLQLTQEIRWGFPSIRIAIVTSYDLPEYKEAAIQYGAEAYFVKESLNWNEIEVLVESILVESKA